MKLISRNEDLVWKVLNVAQLPDEPDYFVLMGEIRNEEVFSDERLLYALNNAYRFQLRRLRSSSRNVRDEPTTNSVDVGDLLYNDVFEVQEILGEWGRLARFWRNNVAHDEYHGQWVWLVGTTII